MFGKLPPRVQAAARRSYRVWRADPFHPGLGFKRCRTRRPVWSVRIGIGYRALCVKPDEETFVWFFIGSHSDYDQVLSRL
jgi:hypothetical protein